MDSQRALAASNLFIAGNLCPEFSAGWFDVMAALEYNDLSCEEGFYRLDHDADGFLSLEVKEQKLPASCAHHCVT